MYKISLTFLTICCSFMSTFAQGDNKELLDRLDALENRQTKVISNLETRMKSDSLRIIMLMDSLRRSSLRMNDLTSSVESYKTSITHQTAIIADVSKKVELGAKSRYESIKKNLILSTEIYEELNQRLTTLYAFSQVESYRTALSMINNPADESMGFSFNKKVEQLLEEKIPIKKNKSSVIQMASVFLQSPAASAIGAAIPFYSVGSSLVSYLASISTEKKEVTPQNITDFKAEIDKYIAFYSKLNHLNSSFISNLDNFKFQSSSLHTKLEDYVTKTLKSAKYPLKTRAEMGATNESEYLTYLFNEFNHKTVRAYFKNLEVQYTKNSKLDYDGMLKDNPQIFEMNRVANEVSFFYRNFEILYSQYISMLEENSKGTMETLEEIKAKKLSDDNSKVDKQILMIKTRKNDAVSAIKTAINIQKVSNLIEQFETVTF